MSCGTSASGHGPGLRVPQPLRTLHLLNSAAQSCPFTPRCFDTCQILCAQAAHVVGVSLIFTLPPAVHRCCGLRLFVKRFDHIGG